MSLSRFTELNFDEFIELESGFEQNSLIDFVKIKCFHNSSYYRSAVIQSFTKTVSVLTSLVPHIRPWLGSSLSQEVKSEMIFELESRVCLARR